MSVRTGRPRPSSARPLCFWHVCIRAAKGSDCKSDGGNACGGSSPPTCTSSRRDHDGRVPERRTGRIANPVSGCSTWVRVPPRPLVAPCALREHLRQMAIAPGLSAEGDRREVRVTSGGRVPSRPALRLDDQSSSWLRSSQSFGRPSSPRDSQYASLFGFSWFE